ncbi:MAG: P13 family porin [Spirochaetales bacterium]|nr:P13 family porin [Spirochaetales bacterium]
MKNIFLALCLILLAAAPLAAQEEQSGKSVFWPIFLNFLPGFGVGSFVQGDTGGGVVLLIADLVGIGLVGVPILTAIGSILWNMVTLQWADLGNGVHLDEVLIVSGLIVFLASKVLGVVFPIIYAANEKAKYESKQVTFNVSPQMEPPDDSGGIAIGLKLSARYAFD